jgi:hypothetical protein
LTSGTVLEMPIRLALEGKPLLFAEENAVAFGGTLTPLDVRFYVSEAALLRQDAEPLPVDIVTSDGAVAPYGVHFFNAEDVASTTLRVLAPAGEYAGITFLLGLAQPCNIRKPELSKAPLSATSQMTWPHTGYLFLRYQGRYSAGTGGASAGGASAGGASTGGASTGGSSAGESDSPFPAVIHMGGNLFEALAPVIRIDAALSVPAGGALSKTLQLAMDQVFEGALSDVDLTDFVGPPAEEVLLGERFRRSVPTLSLFSFAP